LLPFPRALFPSSSSLSLALSLSLVPFVFLLFSIRPSLLWPILFSSLLFSFSSSYILDADSCLRTEESGCLFSPVSSILFLFVSSASDCYSLLSLRFFLRLVLLPLFLFWHRLCFSWLLWVLGPSSSLSLVFRASFHHPFSGHLVLCRVPCFCLRTVLVRRVQGLTSLSCFSELNLSLLRVFFPLCFGVCLFCLFWVFLGWLVSSGYWFGCILVPVPSFVSGVICLPSVISYCGCRIRHIGTGVGFWQFRRLWEQGCCFCAFSSFLPRLHWFSQDLTSAEDLLIFSYLFPLLSSYSSFSLHLIFCFDLILQ
jgi:hypothetical protein